MPYHGVCNVTDIDRLELRVAADHRHERQRARHRREPVEQRVLGTEHERRTHDIVGSGNASRSNASPDPAWSRRIAAGGVRSGTDGGDVHEARDPRLRRDALDDTDAFPEWMRSKSPERCSARMPTALTTKSDTLDRTPDGRLMGDCRAQRHRLPHGAHRFQEQRGFRIPHGHAHDESLMRQPLHDVATDEAGNRRIQSLRCVSPSPALPLRALDRRRRNEAQAGAASLPRVVRAVVPRAVPMHGSGSPNHSAARSARRNAVSSAAMVGAKVLRLVGAPRADCPEPDGDQPADPQFAADPGGGHAGRFQHPPHAAPRGQT